LFAHWSKVNRRRVIVLLLSHFGTLWLTFKHCIFTKFFNVYEYSISKLILKLEQNPYLQTVKIVSVLFLKNLYALFVTIFRQQATTSYETLRDTSVCQQGIQAMTPEHFFFLRKTPEQLQPKGECMTHDSAFHSSKVLFMHDVSPSSCMNGLSTSSSRSPSATAEVYQTASPCHAYSVVQLCKQASSAIRCTKKERDNYIIDTTF
jgi:hypothetical protein